MENRCRSRMEHTDVRQRDGQRWEGALITAVAHNWVPERKKMANVSDFWDDPFYNDSAELQTFIRATTFRLENITLICLWCAWSSWAATLTATTRRAFTQHGRNAEFSREDHFQDTSKKLHICMHNETRQHIRVTWVCAENTHVNIHVHETDTENDYRRRDELKLSSLRSGWGQVGWAIVTLGGRNEICSRSRREKDRSREE